MMPEDVPTEWVEKAAKVMYRAGAWCGVCEFGGWNTCRDCRETVSGYARNALAAVLPDIQAQAWDEGFTRAIGARPDEFDGNPYRAAHLTATTDGTTT